MRLTDLSQAPNVWTGIRAASADAVELPSRPVRRGDKVRIFPPRDETRTGDQRLWRVMRIEGRGADRAAYLRLANEDAAAETQAVPVVDLVTVAEFRDPIYPGLVDTGHIESIAEDRREAACTVHEATDAKALYRSGLASGY